MRGHLIPLVARLLAKHPIAELEAVCEMADLPFARIIEPPDLFDDAHLASGDGLLPITLQEARDERAERCQCSSATAALAFAGTSPQLGEHTDEILRELGLASVPAAAIGQ